MKMTPEQKAFYECGKSVESVRETIQKIRQHAIHEFGEPYYLLMPSEKRILRMATDLAGKIHTVRQGFPHLGGCVFQRVMRIHIRVLPRGVRRVFQSPPLVINRNPRLIPYMPHAERIKSSGRFSHGLIPFSMFMLSVPKENATEKRIFTTTKYPEPFSVIPVHSPSFLGSQLSDA